MDYNQTQIGKIKTYDKITQVGEIVSSDGTFLFLKDDFIDIEEKVKEGDMIQFRAESIHGKNRAFLLKKIEIRNTDEHPLIKNRN